MCREKVPNAKFLLPQDDIQGTPLFLRRACAPLNPLNIGSQATVQWVRSPFDAVPGAEPFRDKWGRPPGSAPPAPSGPSTHSLTYPPTSYHPPASSGGLWCKNARAGKFICMAFSKNRLTATRFISRHARTGRTLRETHKWTYPSELAHKSTYPSLSACTGRLALDFSVTCGLTLYFPCTSGLALHFPVTSQLTLAKFVTSGLTLDMADTSRLTLAKSVMRGVALDLPRTSGLTLDMADTSRLTLAFLSQVDLP